MGVRPIAPAGCTGGTAAGGGAETSGALCAAADSTGATWEGIVPACCKTSSCRLINCVIACNWSERMEANRPAERQVVLVKRRARQTGPARSHELESP